MKANRRIIMFAKEKIACEDLKHHILINHQIQNLKWGDICGLVKRIYNFFHSRPSHSSIPKFHSLNVTPLHSGVAVQGA